VARVPSTGVSFRLKRRTPVADFFKFRLLVVPSAIRVIFLLATIGAIGAFLYIPWAWLLSRHGHVPASSLAIKQIDAAEEKFKNLRTRAQQEREKASSTASDPSAGREAQRNADKLAAQQSEVLSDVGVWTLSELSLRRAELVLKDRLAAADSVVMLIIQLGVVVVAWMVVRIWLEFLAVMFFIHDRLSEISEQGGRADTHLS